MASTNTASFAAAMAVNADAAHIYSADFDSQWCYGSVPHGGFLASIFMTVASMHFRTTLAKQNQPHTITVQLVFLRRAEVGHAELTVRDVRLGGQTSTIQITLCQRGREESVCYITNSNLDAERGLTLSTDWVLQPPTLKVDLIKLRNDEDENWTAYRSLSKFRLASNHLQFYLPRQGQAMSGLVDEWVCFRNGERFHNESLGLLCDMWPMVFEPYQYIGSDTQPALWYPTLHLSLEIKKALPSEGVQWLFSRVRAKQIKNGRFDLEVVILDEKADIVALSHHVAMIVPADRNTAKRRSVGPSKI
ncbi:hypothetical protein MMC07_001983 [Pseudocyphellaria aurata]|nr:hypothetical protein [Pseudocyphellaria aurata]